MNQACRQPTEADLKKMQTDAARLSIEQRMVKRRIMRLYSTIKVKRNGPFSNEKNKLRKKANSALIDQLHAQIDLEYANLELIKFNRNAIEQNIEKLLAVEPEPIVRREQLPPKARSGSPPLMLPPDPPRIATR